MKRKIIIGVVVGVVFIVAVGVAVFFGIRYWMSRSPMMGFAQPGSMMSRHWDQYDDERGRAWPNYPDGLNMQGGRGFGMGRQHGFSGMMPFGSQLSEGDRLTMDQALEKANTALSQYGTNIKVAEIKEFADSFYVSVKETDSGRGAFGLLVDPFNGNVSVEPGPDMMWNTKYGHMNIGTQGQQNELSLSQAADKASAYLKKVLPAAELQTEGVAYYGYATFDYKVNGQVAGMVSVNSQSGAVWDHKGLGVYITEKNIE